MRKSLSWSDGQIQVNIKGMLFEMVSVIHLYKYPQAWRVKLEQQGAQSGQAPLSRCAECQNQKQKSVETFRGIV